MINIFVVTGTAQLIAALHSLFFFKTIFSMQIFFHILAK
jgi:hypothetical protein